MKNIASFLDRQKIVNHGEILFEKYCTSKGYKYHRLGFDEKNNEIPNYWRLNPMIRNLPDYIVNTDKFTFVVNVKGTGNLKQSEVNMLPLFMEWFSTKEAPLIYAFCFTEQKSIMVYPDKIIELYKEAGIDKTWQDGVIYRSLNLPI